ncbi:MAG: MutS-related protein [Flavonifractor plautii]
MELRPGCTVITGANMGGKTVSLRSTVLSLLLCQCGFFVFAKSASLPLFHRVDLILADSGPGAGGLSSFGKEVHLLDTLLRQTGTAFSSWPWTSSPGAPTPRRARPWPGRWCGIWAPWTVWPS